MSFAHISVIWTVANLFLNYFILFEYYLQTCSIWPWKYANDLENSHKCKNNIFCYSYVIFKDNLTRFCYDVVKTYHYRKYAISFCLSSTVWPQGQGQIYKFLKIYFFKNFLNLRLYLNNIVLLDSLWPSDLDKGLTLIQGQSWKIDKNCQFLRYSREIHLRIKIWT